MTLFCIYGFVTIDSQLPKCTKVSIKPHKTVRKMSRNRLQLGSLRCSSRLTSRINPNSYSTSLTIASVPCVPSGEIAGFTIVSGITRQRITASSGIGREVKDLWTYTLKRINSVHRGRAPNPCMSIGNDRVHCILHELKLGTWGCQPTLQNPSSPLSLSPFLRSRAPPPSPPLP